MKIIFAEAIPVRIPLKKTFTIASGSLTHSNHVLVRLQDEQGRLGWGETSTFLEVYGYDQESLTRALNDYLLPAVIGLNPYDLALIHQRLDRVMPYNLMAKAAVDLACYDLAARAANVPMYSLMGGKRTKRVPLISTVDMVPPEVAAELTRELVEKKYTTIKIKIGGKPEEDLARVEAVRRVAGERVGLRVDGNCGYDLATALNVFPRMEEYRLEWIEQPLPAWDLEGHAQLSRRLLTPVALDESIYTAHDVQLCVALKAARVINIKVAKCGGIYRAQKIAAVCRAAGLDAFLGGVLETSPGLAAAAHFYISTPGVISAAECGGPDYFQDDLVVKSLAVKDGHLVFPEGPGLGVEIDEEKVSRYTPPRK